MSRLASHLAASLAALTILAAAPTASACSFLPGFVPPPDQTGLHWGTGGWLIAHAMWSLVATDPPNVTATEAVTPEGATLVVIGTF